MGKVARSLVLAVATGQLEVEEVMVAKGVNPVTVVHMGMVYARVPTFMAIGSETLYVAGKDTVGAMVASVVREAAVAVAPAGLHVAFSGRSTRNCMLRSTPMTLGMSEPAEQGALVVSKWRISYGI